MTNWKDAPHLFANGRFLLLEEFADETPAMRHKFDGRVLFKMTRHPSKFTLIARRIESMTDEEAIKYFDCYRKGYAKDFMKLVGCDIETLKKQITDHGMSFSGGNYLLSIGVYLFPWPNDGSVIDKDKQEIE